MQYGVGVHNSSSGHIVDVDVDAWVSLVYYFTVSTAFTVNKSTGRVVYVFRYRYCTFSHCVLYPCSTSAYAMNGGGIN